MKKNFALMIFASLLIFGNLAQAGGYCQFQERDDRSIRLEHKYYSHVITSDVLMRYECKALDKDRYSCKQVTGGILDGAVSFDLVLNADGTGATLKGKILRDVTCAKLESARGSSSGSGSSAPAQQ